MKYEQVKSLEDAKFIRLTGVKKAIFKKITQLLQDSEIKKKDEGRESLV